MLDAKTKCAEAVQTVPTICQQKEPTLSRSSLSRPDKLRHIYLLLTEFEVRTVSYGPSFFPLIYGPSAKRAGHKSTGKNEDP